MRQDAMKLEDGRLEGLDLQNYPWLHERHRIFPEVLKDKNYEKIIDLAAGVGVVSKRIKDGYPCLLFSNDISEISLKSLKTNNLNPISFDLDDPKAHFPFADESFDAAISLATVEHMINTDHHMMEIRRILKNGGNLFISAPNYSSIHVYLPYLLYGRSFHDPLSEGIDKYEFYAHVRYFTYKTLLEYVSSFGFKAETVYLPLPKESTRFVALKDKSKLLAFIFRSMMWAFYKCLTPRWAFHPVLCFSKSNEINAKKIQIPKKVVI